MDTFYHYEDTVFNFQEAELECLDPNLALGNLLHKIVLWDQYMEDQSRHNKK